MKPGSLLLIFVDGLGVGQNDPRVNPCAHPGLRIFNRFAGAESPALPFAGLWKGIDARLGVAGLPQSATGQTAFMTGTNAGEYLGRHLNGRPSPTLRTLLQSGNLFSAIQERNLRTAFLNAYRPEWFVIDSALQQRFSSVTTVSVASAGLSFFSLDDVRLGRAVYQEFSHALLQQRGIGMASMTAPEAARVLHTAAQRYDFAMFEYFQTDKVAHSRSMPQAVAELRKLERFLLTLLGCADLQCETILLISDHGNIEDLSVKTHTPNPALALFWGLHAAFLYERINALPDVFHAVLACFDQSGPEVGAERTRI